PRTACLLALGFSLTTATVSLAGNIPGSVFTYYCPNCIFPSNDPQSIEATVKLYGHEDFFFYGDLGYPYFYYFSTCPAPGEPAVAEFDTMIEIIDPTGKVVAFNDDGYCGLQSGVSFSPSFAGWYTVRVLGYADSSGTTDLTYSVYQL